MKRKGFYPPSQKTTAVKPWIGFRSPDRAGQAKSMRPDASADVTPDLVGGYPDEYGEIIEENFTISYESG